MYFDICRRIGDLVIQKELINQGLIHGKIGVSIFLYTLAKKLPDEKYVKFADNIIDAIYNKKTPLINFTDGVAGVGWGIEYLIQNGFCEGDADEILEGIDSRIFKTLNELSDIPLNLQGLIGYLQYIIMRLKNNNKISNNGCREINIELFKHIVNRIDKISSELFIRLTQDIKFNLLEDIYILLWSFNSAFQINVYNDKILNTFKQWETYWTSYIPSMHFNRLYLATILFQTNQKLKSKKTEKHIKILLYSMDIDQLRQEIDMSIKKISSVCNGYLGLIFILNTSIDFFDSTYPNYNILIGIRSDILNLCNNKLIEKLEDDLINNKCDINFEFGIAFGWAGVGLFLMLSADDQIFGKKLVDV